MFEVNAHAYYKGFWGLSSYRNQTFVKLNPLPPRIHVKLLKTKRRDMNTYYKKSTSFPDKETKTWYFILYSKQE